MASNKTGLRNTTAKADLDFAKALLKIVAAGVTGGAVLIGAAKSLGETLLDLQDKQNKKLEAQREADKEEVRRITENEY